MPRPYTRVDRQVLGKKGRGPLIPDERRDSLLASLLSPEWTPDPRTPEYPPAGFLLPTTSFDVRLNIWEFFFR